MPARSRRKGTKTSAFGSPGRIGHDSSAFYGGKLYDELPKEEKVIYTEAPLPEGVLDSVICATSERMEQLPDNSVHLMVTSPPYNVGKEYDEDLSLQEYRDFLKRVWAETYRVLVPGGRVCINVANLGRKPYLPLSAYIAEDMVELGYLMRGEVIWNKAASGSPSTAWGTFGSAQNPVLRDIHEYILVFSKGSYSRPKIAGRENTIARNEFLEWSKSVWTFGAESARRVGHPAPFPLELPYRCAQLFTFTDDVVLDPFMGSGQTAMAALKAGRHYVGYELNPEYAELAIRRIRLFAEALTAPALF